MGRARQHENAEFVHAFEIYGTLRRALGMFLGTDGYLDIRNCDEYIITVLTHTRTYTVDTSRVIPIFDIIIIMIYIIFILNSL